MAISGGDGSIVLTTNVDQTGLKKGLGSMEKTAKSFGLGVAKSFAVIGAAVATATVAITKMAVSAYADYEQLVGGVETLFKGSAQKVIDYANNAFYTAGVSANEYMQQVTSFSASLIRSTAGDTDKAADIANMALIDISDNVNKMGSSIESVTLAYQGFAKQQYMLLDNLKLGYGGTRGEMERLLKDAQALTGVKYDINNLADVYSAIHAIQEELGVTGTTAKEAEKTITGSANMMKAAWQNVLSAIAGGGDLDRAINNLVYSIQKFFENIVPVVQRSLVGIGRLIERVAPMLVQNVASALIQSIPSLINAIYQMIVGLAKGIWQGIKALFTGGSGSVTVDIKTSIGSIADEAGNASTGMEELGDATEKAGKQAKKYLAAFDDLNIISSDEGGGAGKIPEFATGGIGGANVPTAESTMDIKAEETGEQATWLSQRLGELAEAFSGLQDIELSNLSSSLSLLKEPLQGLAEIAWDIILRGIKEVIVPLTRFTVKEILPRYFETLSKELRLFKTILDQGFKIFKQFFDEFLKPIAEYTAEGFLKLWDTLNENLEEFVTIVENSTAWQDLQTILGLIYDVLEPVVKWITDFVVWVGKLIINQAWIDLKWLFLDIEDALGLIADIINGDFDNAWGHLKDLMWDNRIDKAKEELGNLKTAFDKVKTKVDEFVESWKTKLSAWWTNNVEPWFAKEKWSELIGRIKDSFLVSDFVQKITEIWGAVKAFWDTNIAPWFTKEKWVSLVNNVKDRFEASKWGELIKNIWGGVKKFWDEKIAPWFTKEKWVELVNKIKNRFKEEYWVILLERIRNGIKDYWDEKIAPWFTKAKWVELVNKIKDRFEASKWSKLIKNIWEGIKTFWKENIAPWFTKEKWVELAGKCGDGLKSGFKNAINSIISYFETLINRVIDKFNTISFTVPDWVPVIHGNKYGVNLSKVSIPRLAQGAVIPGGREFLAVLGDQPKGQTNIEAPATLIKQMVKEGLNEIGYMGGNETITIPLYLDGDVLFQAVVKRNQNYKKALGVSPLGI